MITAREARMLRTDTVSIKSSLDYLMEKIRAAAVESSKATALVQDIPYYGHTKHEIHVQLQELGYTICSTEHIFNGKTYVALEVSW